MTYQLQEVARQRRLQIPVRGEYLRELGVDVLDDAPEPREALLDLVETRDGLLVLGLRLLDAEARDALLLPFAGRRLELPQVVGQVVLAELVDEPDPDVVAERVDEQHPALHHVGCHDQRAATVVVAPIALNLGPALGVDSRPFVFAVCFAASAAFMTPMGYQTNLMVHTAGEYKFGDYLRFGAPLSLLAWILTTALIPVFWPF